MSSPSAFAFLTSSMDSFVETWHTWYPQPVSLTSSMSRSSCFHSLSELSFGKLSSSQCATISFPSFFARFIASRIMLSDATPLPSSVNPITCSAIASMSAGSFPSSPLVIAPYGKTLTFASLAIISSCTLRFSMLSGHGSRFGIENMSVNPPAAADIVPLAIVSLYKKPGSLKCTCTSVRPGKI